jgi:outer membrane protein TolC
MKCRLPVILLMLLVSGCAALPSSVLDSDATSELAVPAVYSTDTPRQSQAISGLPDVFQDPVLDDLVGHALDENLDIWFAVQQLEEVRFTTDALLGDLLPNFSGGLSASRERADLGEATEAYSPTLDVSWEVDLWGQLRASRGSLQAKRIAQMETLCVGDSTAAQVMQSWFDVVLAPSARGTGAGSARKSQESGCPQCAEL